MMAKSLSVSDDLAAYHQLEILFSGSKTSSKTLTPLGTIDVVVALGRDMLDFRVCRRS